MLCCCHHRADHNWPVRGTLGTPRQGFGPRAGWDGPQAWVLSHHQRRGSYGSWRPREADLVIFFKSHLISSLCGKKGGYSYTHFTGEKTKAQKNMMTYLGSHSLLLAPGTRTQHSFTLLG